MKEVLDVCVLISAGAEWRALLKHYPVAQIQRTSFGNCFIDLINDQKVGFLHGGWGKVAAASSTQYAIDRWSPKRVVNLGTCGGFNGQIDRGSTILAQKTVIYDIIEQMTDFDQGIAHYTVDFDLSWVPDPPPQPVVRGTLLSADRDIRPQDIPNLIEKYGAAVADWESGAIAWTAHKNNIPCLILRGVSDLVDTHSGEAYNNYQFFEDQARSIMNELVRHLPLWLAVFNKAK